MAGLPVEFKTSRGKVKKPENLSCKKQSKIERNSILLKILLFYEGK